MHNISQRISIPPWMNYVSKYQWSSIYTSAIDDTIARAFRSDWRRVSRVTSLRQNPIDQTSRKNLHCTYLFGSVIDTREEDIPPFNFEDYEDRCADETYPLLKRIHEKITPLGSFVIENYDPETDWLEANMLKRLIKKLIKGQTFIFSVNDSIKNNEHLKKLIDEGKIITFEEPLHIIMEEGYKSEIIKLSSIPDEDNDLIYINIGEKSFNLPTDIWQKVSQVAEILDSSLFAEPEKLTKSEQEIEFQIFLSRTSKEPMWSDYSRSFAFLRDYQKDLEKEVIFRMKKKDMENSPIILHGQTGTGKTIALQQLAYNVGKHNYPVLYIDEVPQDIEKIRGTIDEFCEWSENNGANKTLIIWDAMLHPDNYQRLFNYLSNRGRKLTIVGSYYNFENYAGEEIDSNYIKAPVSLNKSEIARLPDHFSELYPDITTLIKNTPFILNNNFFVCLYRFLPSSRSNLHEGIAEEAEKTAHKIRGNAAKKKLSFGTSIIEEAFRKAGIPIPKTSDVDYVDDKYDGFDVFNKLIQYVMVPGRLDEDVPLNLIQRTINSSDYSKFLDILENEDMFIIDETNDGDFLIAPRHPLEAKIICDGRFGGPSEEVKHCLDLIGNMNYSSYTNLGLSYENLDLRFVLNLVRKLGPNGPEKERYQKYYLDISKKLEELRLNQSINIPHLILQEANLSREFVRANRDECSPNTKEILENSISLLSRTLTNLKRNKYSNVNLIEQMTVELAAIKSTRLIHILNQDSSIDLSKDFESIHSDLDTVLKKSINDEHALDIYGWITENILIKSPLEQIEKTEILTKALTVIEIGETSAFGINDRILNRKRRLFELMGENKISQEIFNELKRRGSRIGYLRSAIEATSKIPHNAIKYRDEEIKVFKDNYLFLENDRSYIKTDMGCLYQLLKNWWIMKTSHPVFRKENERQTVSFTKNDWNYCLGILEDMKVIGGLLDNDSMMYLYGLALYHTNRIPQSFDVFKSLSKKDISSGGGGGRRIIKYYLASAEDGTPIKYNGRVKSLSYENNYGYVEVEELRRTIRFYPREFRDSTLREGSQMEPFHIGFNFINPIADPVRYYKKYHVE